VGLAGFGGAALADAAAGKATFNDVCSECHETAISRARAPRI